MMFMNRSTTDLVVILLTVLVSSVLLVLVVGAVVARFVHPAIEMKDVAELTMNTISTIVGALVGFIGGRAVGRTEANGDHKP